MISLSLTTLPLLKSSPLISSWTEYIFEELLCLLYSDEHLAKSICFFDWMMMIYDEPFICHINKLSSQQCLFIRFFSNKIVIDANIP